MNYRTKSYKRRIKQAWEWVFYFLWHRLLPSLLVVWGMWVIHRSTPFYSKKRSKKTNVIRHSKYRTYTQSSLLIPTWLIYERTRPSPRAAGPKRGSAGPSEPWARCRIQVCRRMATPSTLLWRTNPFTIFYILSRPCGHSSCRTAIKCLAVERKNLVLNT